MKRILILLIALIPTLCFSQGKYDDNIRYGKKENRTISFLAMGVPNDTTNIAALPDSIKRKPHIAIKYVAGVKTIFLWDTVLYKWDSYASGGGGTDNTNLGSFYRLLVPSSQGIKGIAPGYGTLWDSTSNANSLTSKFDSATVFPQLRATVPLRRFGVSGEDDVMTSSRAVNMGGNVFRYDDGTFNNYSEQQIANDGYVEYFLKSTAGTKTVVQTSVPGQWNVSTTGSVPGNAFYFLNSTLAPVHEIIAGSNMYGIDFNWKMQNDGTAAGSYFRWNRGSEHTDNQIIASDSNITMRSKTNLQGVYTGIFVDSVGQLGLDLPNSTSSTSYKFLLRNRSDRMVYESNYSLSDLLFKSDSLSGGYTTWLRTKKVVDSLGALIGTTPTLQQVTTAGSSSSVSVELSGEDVGTGHALYISNANTPLIIENKYNPALLDVIVGTMYIRSNQSGNGVAGQGIKLDFVNENDAGLQLNTGSFEHILTDATAGSLNSKYIIRGVNNASATNEVFLDIQTGGINITNNGADTLATKAYARSVGGGGGSFSYSRNMITAVAVATDANITAAAGTAYSLPAATLSTDRTIDMTNLNTNGDYIEIDNQEAGFTWSFTGQTVYDAYENAVTVLFAQTRYIIRRTNGKLKIIN